MKRELGGDLQTAFFPALEREIAAFVTEHPAVLEQRGADGDAAIQVAVERKIADAAAIRAARGLLQLGDDLHGADLRRAADRAGGKSRAHQIIRRPSAESLPSTCETMCITWL